MREILAVAVTAAAVLLTTTAGTAEAKNRRYGLMVDAGVPEGASGSFVYRPWSFLRLHAGGGTNLIAPGVRGGLSIILPTGLSANVEAGRAFGGDANSLVRMLSGDGTLDVAALRDVGYDYANFRVGLEFGRTWATFYVHGGMTYLRGTVKNAGTSLSSDETTVTFAGDPRVSVWSPSVRVGLIVYILR